MLGALLVLAALLLSAPATYAHSPDPAGHWVGTVDMPTMEIGVEVDLIKAPSGSCEHLHPLPNRHWIDEEIQLVDEAVLDQR